MIKAFLQIAAAAFLSLAVLSAPSVLSAQTPPLSAQQDGVFSLEPAEGDSPQILKYKAALRIFGGVHAVYQLTQKCRGDKSWAGYEKRNGNTLALAVKQFELGGGFGEAQKTAVGAYAEGQVKEALSAKSCASLLSDIDSQVWDIYKGERFSEDYALISSK